MLKDRFAIVYSKYCSYICRVIMKQKLEIMGNLANTTENNAKVKALKAVENTVGKIFWTGNNTHDNLDKCLTGLNLYSVNSDSFAVIWISTNL